MFSEVVMRILEIIGTISFAVSGAIVAIRARLDLFGVAFVGAVTATGGGIVRDILIGRLPPAVFTNFRIVLIAVVTSLVVFVLAYINRRHFAPLQERIEHINNVFDAIGLAAFSVMGTEAAFAGGLGDNMFLSVVLGMLTGVGGGIFRDILTNTTPYIFKKHIYAFASILGSCLYYLLRGRFDNMIVVSAAAMALVVLVRMLATKYRWSLPKVRLEEDEPAAKS